MKKAERSSHTLAGPSNEHAPPRSPPSLRPFPEPPGKEARPVIQQASERGDKPTSPPRGLPLDRSAQTPCRRASQAREGAPLLQPVPSIPSGGAHAKVRQLQIWANTASFPSPALLRSTPGPSEG